MGRQRKEGFCLCLNVDLACLVNCGRFFKLDLVWTVFTFYPREWSCKSLGGLRIEKAEDFTDRNVGFKFNFPNFLLFVNEIFFYFRKGFIEKLGGMPLGMNGVCEVEEFDTKRILSSKFRNFWAKIKTKDRVLHLDTDYGWMFSTFATFFDARNKQSFFGK